MSSSAPSPATVLEAFATLGPPGTPFATSEVAAEFDCTSRTIYNKLDALVERDELRTKKVGARGRVWWRPVDEHVDADRDTETVTESTFRQLFENVPGLYLIVEPDDYEIVAVSDSYLEATMTERAEMMGKTLFEVFPADPDDPDPEGVPRLQASLERVKTNKQADVMPVTYYPIPRPDSDGDEFEDRWWNPTNSPVVNESGEIDYIIHRVEDVTPVVRQLQDDGDEEVLDRLDTRNSHLATDIMLRGQELHQAKEQAYERLRKSEKRYRTLFESIDEGFCIVKVLFDEDEQPVDYRFLETNPAFEERMGLVGAEGKRIRELEPDHEEHWFDTYGRIALTGESERFTDRVKYLDDRWFDVYAFRFGQPEEQKVAVLFNDITERKRTQLSLERLNAASRELIDADTETVSDRVAELTRDVLGIEYAALWCYDEMSGEVKGYASDGDAEMDTDSVRLPEEFSEQVWQTFIGDDIDVDNALDVPERESSESPLRSRALVPLGRHGVVCAGSTRTGTFDDRTVDLLKTVAATVETAWDRAEGEQELARQNEELTRLDRLNTLIREIDQALVQAETVSRIDEGVCERLANSGLYEFAWIGEYDADTDAVEPRAWAGVESGYLDELTTAADEPVSDGNPVTSAIRTGEAQVVADIAIDPRAAPWREVTLQRGVRSCLSIPLVYDESIYGVLTVYGESPQHDERDSDVLAELGRTIAHAIHAVEARETLRTDSVIELTLRSTAAETPLCRLARETGCVIEFEDLVPGTDGDVTVFFTATGVSPDELVAAGKQSVGIEEWSHLADREEGALFKARLADPTPASRFLERNGVLQTLTIDARVVTAVIDLPKTADVREFVKGVQRDVPDLELLARQARTRPTERTLQTAFEERLTPRQREVLQLAYRSGFFESPRVQTGRELADALDISQSTFNYHLRGAERRLFDVVLERS